MVATSSTSASSYVKEGLSNIRLGMFLELATTVGAISGVFIAFLLKADFLYILFGLLLLYASYSMYKSTQHNELTQLADHNDWLASKLQLNSHFYDVKSKTTIHYYVDHTPVVFGISYIAGIASGLFGVGGGFIKVPAMSGIGKIPIKAASATSNFMIGVTAATTALVYFNSNSIDPLLAAPIALGTLFGALIGVRLIKHVPSQTLRKLFAVVLILASLELMSQGLHIY